MVNFFQYGFMVRGLEAGLILAIIAPMIGIFLVLRRYSLIADTLAHVSLAGVAIGILAGINPIVSAMGVSLLSSLAIEKLRLSRSVSGESALAIFLSGSLALALVLISLANGFNVNLLSFLFGSIVTVRPHDVGIIAMMGLIVLLAIAAFYRHLLYTSFDEEAAQVAGLPVRFVNLLLICLTALTVSLAIPIVGALLIGALIVIPVVAALQLKLNFFLTILISEMISVIAVLTGLTASYYFNVSAGGAIVLATIGFFLMTFLFRKLSIRI